MHVGPQHHINWRLGSNLRWCWKDKDTRRWTNHWKEFTSISFPILNHLLASSTGIVLILGIHVEKKKKTRQDNGTGLSRVQVFCVSERGSLVGLIHSRAIVFGGFFRSLFFYLFLYSVIHSHLFRSSFSSQTYEMRNIHAKYPARVYGEFNHYCLRRYGESDTWRKDFSSSL